MMVTRWASSKGRKNGGKAEKCSYFDYVRAIRMNSPPLGNPSQRQIVLFRINVTTPDAIYRRAQKVALTDTASLETDSLQSVMAASANELLLLFTV